MIKPESCAKCPFFVPRQEHWEWCKIADKSFEAVTTEGIKTKRMSWCPLNEVNYDAETSD